MEDKRRAGICSSGRLKTDNQTSGAIEKRIKNKNTEVFENGRARSIARMAARRCPAQQASTLVFGSTEFTQWIPSCEHARRGVVNRRNNERERLIRFEHKRRGMGTNPKESREARPNGRALLYERQKKRSGRIGYWTTLSLIE